MRFLSQILADAGIVSSLSQSGGSGVGVAPNARSISGVSRLFQIEALDGTAGMFITRNSADIGAPVLNFIKTRGTSLGAVTAVASGDQLLSMTGFATDGISIVSTGVASIAAFVESTISTGIIPTYLNFRTQSTGGLLVEAMRITASQNILIGQTTNPSAYRLAVTGNTGFTGTLAVSSNATIGGSIIVTGTGQFSSIGVGAAASSARGINLIKTLTLDGTGYGVLNDITYATGTQTANRDYFGIRNIITGQITATDAGAFSPNYYTNYNNIFFSNANLKVGNAYATLSEISFGSSSGTATHLRAAQSTLSVTAGTVTQGRSLSNNISVSGGTVADAYANISTIAQSSTGAITTGYLYYGAFSGTIGTKWGLYLDGESRNFLTGNLQIGSATPTAGVEKLQVTGSASISTSLLLGTTLTMTASPTASAGVFEIITRNLSTGVVEKIASSYYIQNQTASVQATAGFRISTNSLIENNGTFTALSLVNTNTNSNSWAIRSNQYAGSGDLFGNFSIYDTTNTIHRYVIGYNSHQLYNGTNSLVYQNNTIANYSAFASGTVTSLQINATQLILNTTDSTSGNVKLAVANTPLVDLDMTASASSLTISAATNIIANVFRLSTTPSTSAGTYDIITRNTSTGNIEKVTSSGAFIQNQIASAQAANLWISADAKINQKVYIGTNGAYFEEVLVGAIYKIKVTDSAGNVTVL